jgi:hypothetical protein
VGRWSLPHNWSDTTRLAPLDMSICSSRPIPRPQTILMRDSVRDATTFQKYRTATAVPGWDEAWTGQAVGRLTAPGLHAHHSHRWPGTRRGEGNGVTSSVGYQTLMHEPPMANSPLGRALRPGWTRAPGDLPSRTLPTTARTLLCPSTESTRTRLP